MFLYLRINSNQEGHRIQNISQDVTEAQLILASKTSEPHDHIIQEFDEGIECQQTGSNIQDQHDCCRGSLATIQLKHREAATNDKGGGI